MKKIHFILFSIALLTVLLVFANWRLKELEPIKEDKFEMTYDNLFVQINSDTLVYYLNTYKERHPSIVVKDNSHELVIEHNKYALILLNLTANDMPIEREEFVKSGIVSDSEGKTTLRLKKRDGYVECPAPILSEILRLKNMDDIEHR